MFRKNFTQKINSYKKGTFRPMRILLVEDEKNLCDSIAFQLKEEGYVTDTCYNGLDAWYYISQRAHDLLLLDRMLPELNGIELLKKMRKEEIMTPVILLTALGSLQDKITGLDAGADDYIVKPFAFEELLARIRSISRRPRDLTDTTTMTLGDITYKPSEYTLQGPDGQCTCSKKEGSLLEVFIRNASQTLPRMTLLTKVWGPDAEVEEGNLDNYIHFLRRRLHTVGSQITIKTVRGVGYQIQCNQTSAP